MRAAAWMRAGVAEWWDVRWGGPAGAQHKKEKEDLQKEKEDLQERLTATEEKLRKTNARAERAVEQMAEKIEEQKRDLEAKEAESTEATTKLEKEEMANFTLEQRAWEEDIWCNGKKTRSIGEFAELMRC